MKKASRLLRVMVVEDDPTFRSFWRRVFKELGVDDYVIYSDAKEATRSLDGSFGLLISDVIMPRMNGYELAKYACKHYPNLKIVLTTGYTTDLSHFNLNDCSFHLIHKPYNNIAEIKKMILHLLKGEDVFEDASDDSFSENEDYPLITEWRL